MHEHPHDTHDLSAAAQHLLLTAAFSPEHSQSPAADMRDSRIAADEHYANSPAHPIPLFNSSTTIIDPLDVDFNRIGILLESRDEYLIFVQPLSTTSIEDVRCG